MYISKEGHPTACPDAGAGLYVKTREGQALQVAIPEGQIAYQLGEVAQVGCLQQFVPRNPALNGTNVTSGVCNTGPIWRASMRDTTLCESAMYDQDAHR